MVIAANAKTTKHRTWDAESSPPGIGAVLDVVTGGPMDDVSFDSVEMTDGHFKQMKQLARTVDSCNKRISQRCPEIPPIIDPITTDFTFVELTFDDIPDPRLRRCLQELPRRSRFREDSRSARSAAAISLCPPRNSLTDAATRLVVEAGRWSLTATDR
jgi:hypothetical protein